MRNSHQSLSSAAYSVSIEIKSNYERKKKTKEHAPLQDSVGKYIRKISKAMFLQIQSDHSFVITKSIVTNFVTNFA